MSRPFSDIRSAAIDGRALNPIFRKVQLKQLHDALSDSADAIRNAIASDTGHTQAEVKTEYWLAMRQLANAYASLDPDKILHDEYAVSRETSAPDRREAVGIVVIHPAQHAFFSCLMSALIPALAAGNCVVVQTEQSPLQTPRLVLDLIGNALDDHIFHATQAQVTDSDLAHRHIRVLQNGSDSAHLSHHLVSDPKARVVAVVERDADLDAAAQDLVKARFALRGRSPYAPDLVLVNEWVKREFFEHLVRHAARFSAEQGRAPPATSQRLTDLARKEDGVNIFSSSSVGAVVEVQDRNSTLLRAKVQESCLFVHAVTSVDDAIDFSTSNGRLGAAYVFTTPSMAKYMCQFLDTPMSFVNHVPTSLLYLPTAPLNQSLDLETCTPYNEALFSRPKAQFAAPSAQDAFLRHVFQEASPQQLAGLDQEASARVEAFKRTKKGVSPIGFFDKGVITGGILLLSTVFTVVGLGGYYGLGMARTRVLSLFL